MSSLPVDFFIIGLGNPDPQYAISRHNVGYVFCNFLANAISMSQAPEGAAAVPVFWRRVDVMADVHDVMYQVSKKAGGVEISKSLRLIIAKPLSGMNESGGSVARLLQRYGVDPVSDKTAIAKKLMVVFDDLNTLPGAIVVEDGGELRAIRGHKGVESIADIMGPDFIRFRIGIGRPPLSSTVTIPNFVLSPFAIGKETNLVGHALELTVGALKDIAEGVTFGDGAGWSTAPTGLPLKEVVKKAKKKFGTKKLPNQLKEMTGLYFPVDTHGI